MHDAVPSCFRGGAAEAAAPPASCTQARPRVTTSVYETRLGAAAALTWYRTALGLSLHVDLLLPSPAASPSCSSTSSVISSDEKNGTVRFRLRPWLLWKRRGTKRFYLKGDDHQERSSHRTVVDFAWDLARARFSPGGGPEPASRFFVAVAVDGEMFLVVGDMEAEAHRKTTPAAAVKHSISSLCSATLVSKTEHAVLPSSGRSSYTTRASLGGKEREICIDLGGEEGERDAKLRVALDGGRVLDVKRLQWKFRGSEEVEVDGGAARVQVSWDVHRWLFGRRLCPLPPASAAAASSSEPGHAVLLLRFDREEPEEEEGDVEACVGKHRRGGGGGGSCIPRVGTGEGMVGSLFSGGAVEVSRNSGRTRSLLKTRSSSSSSSASSGSGSSVMEWASAEDVDLQGSDSFSLVVNLWKG